MAEFYVTFGQKYPREEHPTFPAAHRDGCVVIVAADREEARAATIALLGQQWCDLYSAESWASIYHMFPLGMLGRFQAADLTP